MSQRTGLREVLAAAMAAAMVCSMGLPAPAAGQARKTAAPGAKAAAAVQQNDADYTAKIREYTTSKEFITDLVDHLPASDKVPSPQKVLGYVIGTPGKLTYTKDIYRYYRELEKASPRVKVWSVGKSEEGREFLLVAVTDESNMAQLEKFKQITAKLADPRKISDAEAQQLAKEGKPFYWASGSIHSPETGSPEMLMEMAYRLSVEDTPFIQNIRKNLIFLITPVVEVDGRDRMVDLYNYRVANPNKQPPGLIYWGKYVAHDNNRDSMGQALQLSKVMMKNFLDWHPQVLHDLHESVPYLYTSTGTGPYNAWLDPLVVSEWQKMAYWEIENMTARGVPGVWTHGFYDGWAPNYMFYVANGHNSIGRFYETFGNGGADTRTRSLGANNTSRTWFRPNPPYSKVVWSIRNNVNMQQSALLFALQYVADNGAEFLSNFYLKGKRSIAKATTEGPAAWVIENDGKRPGLAAGLARLMQNQGAEVHLLSQDTEVTVDVPAPPAGQGGRRPAGDDNSDLSAEEQAAPPAAAQQPARTQRQEKLPAGSYVIRMDQPYSRMVDMLLDTQYYSTADPRPYDDTGWTLGPLRNVKTLRVTDAAILKAPMSPAGSMIAAAGAITGSAGTKYYVVNATAEPALATLRFKLKDVKFWAAEEPFEADGKKFSPGSFLIPTDGNPSDLRSRIEGVAKPTGLLVHATDADIKAAKHAVSVPRIALMHTWTNTQNEGWYRLMMDEAGVPYDYISDQDVRTTPNLKSKYDVILIAPVSGSAAAFINGVRKRTMPDGSDFGGPIPWTNSSLTPNIGNSPGTTGDIRGGLGFEGLANLKKFIEEGGLFMPISIGAALPVETGMTEGVSIVDTTQLQARGAIFNATVADAKSPIAYGYDETVALYFNQSPVFRVSPLAGGFGGGGGGAGGAGGAGGRVSGRGSSSDPDIPQGRPFMAQERETPRNRAQQETYIDPEVAEQLRGSIPPRSMWPRVVLRWAEERNLWVSGMLAGGAELAQAPAVVDVPLGRGHIVLFANNPMWRHQTQGTFMLVLNAALHFDNLGAGRSER